MNIGVVRAEDHNNYVCGDEETANASPAVTRFSTESSRYCPRRSCATPHGTGFQPAGRDLNRMNEVPGTPAICLCPQVNGRCRG